MLGMIPIPALYGGVCTIGGLCKNEIGEEGGSFVTCSQA